MTEPIQRIAVLIVNWNRADLTLEAVLSAKGSAHAVYVLDNDSAEDDFSKLKRALEGMTVTLIRAKANLGYAGGNNLAADAALAGGCDALLVMNNDACAEPGAIEALAWHLDAHPTVGVAMPTVVSTDGVTVLHGACLLDHCSGTPGWDGIGLCVGEMSERPGPTDYVSGEAFLCRAKVLEQCGFFDERFFCYYEDVDWSVRVARAGWGLDYVPNARFRHAWGGPGASVTGAFYRARNLVLLQRYTFGRTRTSATLRSLGPLTRAVGAHLWRGDWQAARQIPAGLLAALRSRDA